MQLLNFFHTHKLVCILSVGLVIRVLLMPISAHSFDVYAWYQNANDLLTNGIFSLQDFPPFWYHYLMVPVAYSYDLFAGVLPSWVGAVPMVSLPAALDFYPAYNVEVVPGLLFNFIVKFPFLISDVLLALLLYKIVGALTGNNGLAEKATFLWFLNPFVIWISAGWGMWDTLPALFSLVAFYFLLKKKYALSGVALSIGVALKLYPLLFLVPIIIYLFKAYISGERRNSLLKFFGSFFGCSALIFLPYIDRSISFFSDFFLFSAAAIDPVVEPLGFGLSYWSLFLLNRLFNLTITADFVSTMAVFSVLLVAVFVGVVYWRISKFSFKKPVFDLNLAFLLSLCALFLSYRVVCEQFFIWLIPMLIILYISGKVRGALYWGISLVALVYCLLNLPVPFFFLPLAPWIGNNLLSVVYAIWPLDSLRIIFLAIFGCLFSIILFYILSKLRGSFTLQKIF
ncbi:MAG: DUF2029 domain-containing protein [Crenarchaeota archaeon]|nr:DUF2029 domain-containing protein [Thermoproteota archaeon]